jgi:hypothetical protein
MLKTKGARVCCALIEATTEIEESLFFAGEPLSWVGTKRTRLQTSSLGGAQYCFPQISNEAE